MRRFLPLLLALVAWTALGQSPVLRNTWTTNTLGKAPNLLPSITDTHVYPLLITEPDGTGTARTLYYMSGFFMRNSVANFPGTVGANVAVITNTLKVSGSYVYPLLAGSNITLTTNTVAAGQTNITIAASASTFVGIYRDQSIEAGAMLVGNLASPATTGTYTNSQDDTLSDSWTFADAATNSVRFALTLPDVWNLGTVKLKLYVTCDNTNNTSTNLVWGVKAGSLAPLESLTGAIFGTEVYVTNGLDVAGNVMQVFTTPAITIGGSPGVGDSLWFNISREGGNASDTWTNTPVRLLKARVQWLESQTAPSSW